tara:strand:+ start:300 stop:488 length:189 start_codon:yes stop_codon:yes gene_type:complete
MKEKKEEPRKYAKDREEYFREFHSVIAPVVVLDGYEYERKYDEEMSFCKHPDDEDESNTENC